MNKIKIRRANVGDVHNLIPIVQGVKSIEDYSGEYNKKYFNKMLKMNIVMLAEINEKITGFIEIEWDKDAKRVFLRSIAVSKAFRDKGIGNRLFEEVELFAKKHKAKRISMLVRDWNKEMNGLAKKKGFVKSDILYGWGKLLYD